MGLFSIQFLIEDFLLSLVQFDRGYASRIWMCGTALVLYFAFPFVRGRYVALAFKRIRRSAWRWNFRDSEIRGLPKNWF